MRPPFRFELLATCGAARCGRIHTPHGPIDTPAFMPVGTRAAVKGVAPDHLAETGAQIVLANTYHLLMRPTAEVVAALGGLHRFMNWPGPILTDSGGFQVFSLGALRTLDDDGATFQSHLDGALIRLGPEEAIRVQRLLGADIIMCFDECPPLPAGANQLRRAVDRTIAWARRCRAAHEAPPPTVAGAEAEQRPAQALYGIVQGGLDSALRGECLERLVALGFDGYALGGLSVGEPPAAMHALLAEFAHRLPADQPRYLMGVGTPLDLVEAVAAGIDQFDCVLPTRNGRKGYAFTSAGVLRLRNAGHRLSREPLDPDCDCRACRGFSRGYLRHLLLAGEVLGATLVSLHNLRFYQRLMARMRAALLAGGFPAWREAFLAGPAAGLVKESA